MTMPLPLMTVTALPVPDRPATLAEQCAVETAALVLNIASGRPITSATIMQIARECWLAGRRSAEVRDER